MALKYGFYDSVNGDRQYSGHDFTQIMNNIIMDGVLPKTVSTNQFAATPATSGLGVKIDSGWAWFDSTYTYLTAPQTFSLDAADAVLYRWDAIVIETDSENRENSIKVIKGTPAAEGAFVKPTLTANQHPLCYAKVTPGLTSMVQGNIENRVGFSDCPFITGVVGTADISQMFMQWQYDFDEWFSDLSVTLSGDVAANLLARIQANEAAISDLDDNKADITEITRLEGLLGSGGNNCRVAFGAYIGNGRVGVGNPNSLTFDFTPALVVITPKNDQSYQSPAVMVLGSNTTGQHNLYYHYSANLTWQNNMVSWYSASNDAAAQLNTSGAEYCYVALGYNQ